LRPLFLAGVPGDQDRLRPFGGKRLGNRAADPIARAGDDRHPVL
jgi:hypothetical protein